MLSIITEPWGFEKIVFNIRRIFSIVFKRTAFKKYGGHFGVRRSLQSGLKQLGFEFNYNPALKDLYETVLVLSNIAALRQCIDLKKQGKIKRLIAGPNVVDYPDSADGIISSEEIDVCLVPSQWFADYYLEKNKSFEGRIRVWPAGVDTEYWKPFQTAKHKVLVYYKNSPREVLTETELLLGRLGKAYKLISYGSYKEQEFKDILDQSSVAIFLSLGETQGIALLEAWSMNVPTFVWKNNRFILTPSESPAPYLSLAVGAFWTSQHDLEMVLRGRHKYSPRAWVVENMSDKISAQKFIDFLNALDNKQK